MTKPPISIVWFRQDLRLQDNSALIHATRSKGTSSQILPIYIVDTVNNTENSRGAASNWWLHYSLQSLQKSLGNNLSYYQGDAIQILDSLTEHYTVSSIYWNRCYEPWRTKRDKLIKNQLELKGIKVHDSNGSLLFEPWNVFKESDHNPYLVYTPFYKKCLEMMKNSKIPRDILDYDPKHNCEFISDEQTNQSLKLSQLKLLPLIKWDRSLEIYWNVNNPDTQPCPLSEEGAMEKLDNFLQHGISNFKTGRNFPSKPHFVSQLSPYLHQGQISPHQIWNYTLELKRQVPNLKENIEQFQSELIWREFSYSQLYHFPTLPFQNLRKKFDDFPWVDNPSHLTLWKKEKTGIPIVDAGMRQLWKEGYMHGRVRMIVASFLVKNLLLDWRQGERHFWDCLVDADLASNSASWQWVAGCGLDAAPYFRIFNPITQSKKFDKDGAYIKKYVPELNKVPVKYVYSPWEASSDVLKDSGVILGETYPKPIVDLGKTRKRALDAFASLKKMKVEE